MKGNNNPLKNIDCATPFDKYRRKVAVIWRLLMMKDRPAHDRADVFWKRVRTAADRLGVNRDTSKKWKQKNSIPAKWHYDLVTMTMQDPSPLLWKDVMNPPVSQNEGV